MVWTNVLSGRKSEFSGHGDTTCPLLSTGIDRPQLPPVAAVAFAGPLNLVLPEVVGVGGPFAREPPAAPRSRLPCVFPAADKLNLESLASAVTPDITAASNGLHPWRGIRSQRDHESEELT